MWADLADVASHAEWMRDADAVRLEGLSIEADTRFGPFRLTDRMEITEWRPGVAIGVRHVGIVSGEGRFSLEAVGPGLTRVIWDERLRFPWLLGGVVGERVARPIFRSLFRANLRAFAERHPAES